MPQNSHANFAARLVGRLSAASCLIDAASGETVGPPALGAAIGAFGAAFAGAGLEPGDRVLLGCGVSARSSLAYLGAIYAGLVAVPVEARTLPGLGEALCRHIGARAVWMEREPRLAWLARVGARGLSGDLSRGAATDVAPAARAEGDLAALMATSGSTGTPRFVKVTHGNLLANTEAIVRSQRLAHDERAMLILPVSYCFGASVLHSHLFQGGSVVFDGRFTYPDTVLQAMAHHCCTTFAGVPTVYNLLLRRSNLRALPLPCLRRFLQAGGPLAPDRIREMRHAAPTVPFYVMYGQTEATARLTCLAPEDLERKLGSAGRPLDNLRLKIVDENGQELPPGEVGEILAAGPSICQGYWNDPVESQQKFVDGWLHTRDLGHLDAEGYLWIQGRKGAFLKVRGIRLSFAEVEARVAAVPGVYECAVAAVPHPEAGEALFIQVVPEPGREGVAELVRRSLPPLWTCHEIKTVAELPKTSTGKLARGASLDS